MNARRIVLVLLAFAVGSLCAWLLKTNLAPDAELATADKAGARSSESSERPTTPTTAPDVQPADVAEPEETRAPAIDPPTATGRIVIRGRVYDALNGEPWFGATIEARYRGGESFMDTESDEAGLYRLEIDGAPARLDLAAFVEERAALLVSDIATDGGKSELVIDFALPGAFAVAGRVLDARTKQPIAGAELKVFADGEAFEEGWNDGFSDDKGRFHIDELEDLPRNGLHLVVLAEEYQPAHLANLAVPAGADTLTLDVLLEEPRVLRGRVVAADGGAPIADARVETSSRIDEFAEAGEEARTAEDGSFELPLGDLPPADALLYVQAKSFATQRLDGLAKFADGTEIRLARPSTLAGRVLDGATRKALAEVEVRIEPRGMPASVAIEYADTTPTDDDGRFAVQLESVPLGAVRVFVSADGFALLERDVTLPLDTPLELALERSLLVTGRVTRTSDGEPVRGARIRALPGRDHQVELPSALTGKDGEYELELALSAAREATWVLEYQGRRHALEPLTLADDAPPALERNLALDLPAPRGVRVEKPTRTPPDDRDK
ncbi:MAG: carboxypeptidase regulatory-like domain-containing protein [Planctomycetes bacterium]|nr:carboxypeptidase regulatory-like domain-containing protein [Planctomycetota bacterium]